MHTFKDFGIKPQTKSFDGDKIKMDKILNKQILVEEYKINPSKFNERGSGKLLTMQIYFENQKRIVFSGSANLMEMIDRVPKDKFPFFATIVKENERFEFT